MRYLLATIAAVAFVFSAGASYAAGDAAKGKKQFSRCKTCHVLVENKNRVGPSLYKIMGRKAATVPKFKYSKSLKEAGEKGLVWDEKQLFAYLEDPTKFLKAYLKQDKVSNKMKNKFKKKALRENIIAYLKAESSK